MKFIQAGTIAAAAAAAKRISATRCYPDERHCGYRDDGWNFSCVKAPKIESISPVPVAIKGLE